MSQQLQFTPGGPSFWAGLVEFAVVDTASGQVLVQQANRDESEAVPFTGAPSPADPITRLTNAGLVQLVGSPIAFINPITVAEYQVQDTTAVRVTYLSGRSQAFTYAAMLNFLAWTPPVSTGVFEPGTGLGAVQQANTAQAIGQSAFAVGLNALAQGTNSIAIGEEAIAGGVNAIAIGSSVFSGTNGVALGVNAATDAVFPNIAIGQNSASMGNNAIAIGASALADFENSVAIGYTAYAADDFAVAIGSQVTSGNYSTAIGPFVNASAPFSIAIGFTATTTGTGASIALLGMATGISAVAIGSNTIATNNNAVVFQQRTSTRDNCVFIRHLDILDAFDIHLGTTNGTRLGTFQGQKLGFWGATPIVRPNVSTAGTVQDQISAIRVALNNMGLINLI